MSKRPEIREKRAKEERNQKIFLIGGVVLVALAIAAFLILPTLQPVGAIADAPAMNRPQVSGHGTRCATVTPRCLALSKPIKWLGNTVS